MPGPLKWPNNGFVDLTRGASRLVVEQGSVDTMVASGLSSIRTAAYRALEATAQAQVDVLLERVSFGAGGSGDAGDPSSTSAGLGALVVDIARKQIGKPYKWAAAGPDEFDCSGLVIYCYKEAGVSLSIPHSSKEQDTMGDNVKTGSPSAQEAIDLPAAGDLITFGSPVHHVGICIGGKSGEFIHAPKSGDVVKISKITSRSDVAHIRRLLKDEAASGPVASVDGTGPAIAGPNHQWTKAPSTTRFGDGADNPNEGTSYGMGTFGELVGKGLFGFAIYPGRNPNTPKKLVDAAPKLNQTINGEKPGKIIVKCGDKYAICVWCDNGPGATGGGRYLDLLAPAADYLGVALTDVEWDFIREGDKLISESSAPKKQPPK